MNRTVPLCFLLISLAACNRHPESMSEAERDSVASGVRQTLEHYYADIEANGLLSEFDYLDSSSNFFWVPPGTTVALSYDSIHELISLNARAFKSVVNSWDTLRIVPLNNDHALYTGRLNSVMTDTAGNVSTFKLVETGVLIKRGGKWKLLSGQTSLVPE